MTASIIRSSLLIALSMAIYSVTIHPGHAGGGSFEENDENNDDSGPPFIGDVKDRDGNPIPDAKVSVAVTSMNSSLFMRADDQGHFTVRGFDKEIPADSIEITCSMDGYKPYAISRQPTGADLRSPIEVICLLEKTK